MTIQAALVVIITQDTQVIKEKQKESQVRSEDGCREMGEILGGSAQAACVFGEGDAAVWHEHRKARERGHRVHVCKVWEKRALGAGIHASKRRLDKEGVRHMPVQECWEKGC